MSKSPKWALMVGLTALVMTGCRASETEPGETPTPVPGIDSTLAAGEVRLQVLEASRRETFQVSYIMHYPEPGATFVQVGLAIHGAEDPVGWGEGNVTLVYPGGEGELVASRPTTGAHGLSTRYLVFYQVPEASEFASY
jgi:hypothetical protein